MTDETTNPGARAPERPWWADPRTLLILALLGGTGIGGGSATLLGGNTRTELADAARELTALRQEITLMRGEFNAANQGALAERRHMRDSLADHESRLREVRRLVDRHQADGHDRARR